MGQIKMKNFKLKSLLRLHKQSDHADHQKSAHHPFANMHVKHHDSISYDSNNKDSISNDSNNYDSNSNASNSHASNNYDFNNKNSNNNSSQKKDIQLATQFEQKQQFHLRDKHQNNTLIAIDLGTSNSLVGIFANGQVRLFENAYGSLLTPSAIALDEQQQLLIGQAAVQMGYAGLPVLSSFKRLMGSATRLKLGQVQYNAITLSSMILSALKHDAELALGHDVHQAVITVPAYFNDIQRQATISAAKLAGLEQVYLINEPTAAALAYGLGQNAEHCYLIFDLGGGTFDVSIVELFEGVIEVRASAGDNELGGDDFVALIVKQFWQKFAADLGQAGQPIPEGLHNALTARAKVALHGLSQEQHSQLDLSWESQNFHFEFSQAEYNQWAQPLLQRMRVPLERALRDARIQAEQIDQVVMVGGATRLVAVRHLATKLFGRFPSTSIQPDEAVVRGACVQAGLKAKDQALREIVLTDVCPFSLGISVGEDELFSPILERNIVIPASRVSSYTTMHQGQRQITLKIYQGEHRLCKENVFLGELDVHLAENNGQESIDVRFSYNTNGILDIDVYIPSTGEHLQKVLINHKSMLSEEEIDLARAQLDALKFHPRDNLLNKALLLRAERLFREHTGELRMEVAAQIEQFERYLNTQDERLIREQRPHFEIFLNQVESLQMFDHD